MRWSGSYLIQGHEGNLEGFSSQNQGNPIKVQTKWEQKFDGGKKSWISRWVKRYLAKLLVGGE